MESMGVRLGVSLLATLVFAMVYQMNVGKRVELMAFLGNGASHVIASYRVVAQDSCLALLGT